MRTFAGGAFNVRELGQQFELATKGEFVVLELDWRRKDARFHNLVPNLLLTLTQPGKNSLNMSLTPNRNALILNLQK